MSPIPNTIIAIVFDDETKRLRATPAHRLLGGWVRFPKRLRILGARYMVEHLKPLPGHEAWVASGKIERVA